jgi:hypothetical protein
MVFEISEQELLDADRYEVAAHKRVATRLGSGKAACVGLYRCALCAGLRRDRRPWR